MSENANSPAFPVPTVFNPVSGEPRHTGQFWNGNGLTKREEIAKCLMAALLQTGGRHSTVGDCAKELGIEVQNYNALIHWPLLCAKDAVRCTDALLAELEKKQ